MFETGVPLILGHGVVYIRLEMSRVVMLVMFLVENFNGILMGKKF